MSTFTVAKNREIRGLTYLTHGQQYTGYLPRGEYSIVGDCLVNYSDLGIVKQSPAVKLISPKGESWYVAPSVVPPVPASK